MKKNKKRFKHLSTSSANPNERDLARWMEVQKMAYKKGRLTKYQIERLEIIPMWSWENPISPEDHEAPENLPKPSALDKVSLEELVKYTAMGFELISSNVLTVRLADSELIPAGRQLLETFTL